MIIKFNVELNVRQSEWEIAKNRGETAEEFLSNLFMRYETPYDTTLLESTTNDPLYQIERIQKLCACVWKIPLSSVQKKGRDLDSVEARFASISSCKKHLDVTRKQIASMHDLSTLSLVSYAEARTQDFLSTDKKFSMKWVDLQCKIENDNSLKLA